MKRAYRWRKRCDVTARRSVILSESSSTDGRFDRSLSPERHDRVDSRRPPRRDIRRDRANRHEH